MFCRITSLYGPHVWHGCCIAYHVFCKVLQGEELSYNSWKYDYWFHTWNKHEFLNLYHVWVKAMKNNPHVKIVECDAYVLVEVSFALVLNLFFFGFIFFILEMWIALSTHVTLYGKCSSRPFSMVLHTRVHFASQLVIILT